MSEYRLELKDIVKEFPGVIALNHVSLQVRPGSVHALMGENGAGKSTLMKCLFGIYSLDGGQIMVDGEPVVIHHTKEALDLGVAMIHQELQPIPEMTIAENIFMGNFPTKGIGPLRFVDQGKINHDASELLKIVKLNINPKTKLSRLTISQMQMVEIAKAISHNARVFIMDEPTSSLTENETDALFDIIKTLREQGNSIIYISHKMDEILKISDEVTVLRDGRYIGTWPSKELTTNMIIAKMVGRDLTEIFPDRLETRTDEVTLKIVDVSSIYPKSFQHISFELHRGEVLGIGGLVGAQRTELVEGIFGIRALSSGTIYKDGKMIKIRRPEDSIRHGIAMLTEDRRGSGIFGVLSVRDNVAIASLDKYVKFGLIDAGSVRTVVNEGISQLSIKTPSDRSLIQSLSGGNQQKVIFSRWLANDPDILILDEPTRGIDVGAKYEIYTIINTLVAKGKSVIMITSEMSELLGMADRILVMCDGKLSGELSREEATQEKIMELATRLL